MGEGEAGDFVSIGVDGCGARIARRGAELRSWSVGGRELIWQGDPASWGRSAPILFPAVGRSAAGAVRIEGRTYPMPIHGFASACDFAVERAGPDEATLCLTDTAATRRHYPFAFRLSVTFALSPGRLAVTLRVANEDARPMPYAAGLHPGFAWPARGSGAPAIRFDADERASVPVITPDGFFAPERRPVAIEGRTMALTPDNVGNEAVCFLDASSRSVTFLPGDGSALAVEQQGFAHFAFWTMGEAPFLSIESWTGHGDAPGYDGEFAGRASMIMLAPGQVRSHSARYAFGDAA